MKKLFLCLLFLLCLGCNYYPAIKVPAIPIAEDEKTLVQYGLERALVINVTTLNQESLSDPFNFGEIQYDLWQGTGVRIAEDKILTAYHVVKDAILISADVYQFDPKTNTRSRIASIALESEPNEILTQYDVAILKIKKDTLKFFPTPIEIASDTWSPALDEYLYTFGFKTGWQKVSYVKPVFMYYGPFRIPTIRVFPVGQVGDSGGFVLNKQKQIVGIEIAAEKGEFTVIVPITMLDLLHKEN